MRAEDAALNGLRWRCRRGMLELDVVLAQFLARHDGALTLAEREAFSALLELPDPVLWDLIIGKAQSDNTRLARILEWLRAA